MIFNNDNPDNLFKKINFLHLISLIIQTGLILGAYFFVTKKDTFAISNPQSIIYIQYLFIFIAMLTLPLSEYLLKKRLKKALTIEDNINKLEVYLTAIIMKLSLIELVNIIVIVIYFMSGHRTFLYIAVILVLFFLLSKPAKEKTFTDLNL